MAKNRRVYTVAEDVEVAGTTTLSFIENISSNTIDDLRKKHGLIEIDTDSWYPLQKIFGLFNDIAEKYGTQPFVAMGMKIAEQSEFPPEMLGSTVSMAQILEGWQAHYEANHRGGTLPPVETKKVADDYYQLICQPDHLYPFDLVYGMAYGFCKLLLPKGTRFIVAYDEKLNPMLREESDGVIVNIKWGESA